MRFFGPVPRTIFFCAPLFFLLFRINPIHTSSLLLLAYGIPHWLLGQLAYATVETRGHLSFTEIIRTGIVAVHLLIRTTKSLALTELGRLRTASRAKSSVPFPSLIQPLAYIYGVGIGLHLFAAYASMMRPALYNTPQNGMTPIYYVWAIYSVLLLIANIAIHKESGLIRWTRQQRSKMQAMIKLPSKHLISCTTSNFPALELQCTLPSQVILEVGTHVSISIFRGYHEYVFTAQVVSRNAAVTTLSIDQAVAVQYLALGKAVFSRDASWPQWLPNQYADRLMPSWAQKLFDMAQSAFYNLVTRSALPRLAQRLKKWVLLGKIRNV
jgi:cellulose synthase (UDP-forming)